MRLSFVWIALFFTGIPHTGRAQAPSYLLHWREAERLAGNGKYPESLVLYEKALDQVRKSDPVWAANLCNDISSVHYGLHEYEISLRYCREGIAYLKASRTPPDSIYFKIYSSLGTMHNSLNHPDSSSYYFMAADRVIEKEPALESQIPSYILHHYLHQGRSFWALHRYHHSISYFLKAQKLSEKFHLDSERDYIQSSLAETYDLLGQHEKALIFRLTAASHSTTDLVRKQGLFSGVAFTYQRLGMLDSALHWQNRSEELLLRQSGKTNRNKQHHIELLLLKSIIQRQKKQLGPARKLLVTVDRLLKAYTEEDQHYYATFLLIEKGLIARTTFRYEEAGRLFSQAFSKATMPGGQESNPDSRPPNPQVALLALQLSASTLFQQYRESGKLGYLTASFDTFGKLVRLKKSMYFDAAEDVSDRLVLSYESYDLFREAIPAGYAYYQSRPSAEILQELFEWFEDANAVYLYDVLRKKMTGQVQNAHLSEVKYQSSAKLTFQTVQKQLGNKSAFLSYKWFGNQMYAIVVTRDTTQLVSWQVNASQLKLYLSDLQAQFSNNPGFGKYLGSSSAIGCYRTLIEPLRQWTAGKNQLVIARDWQFNFLPFELLETGKTVNDYLAKTLAISYTYSASFFWQHPFHIFADPAPERSKRNLVIAPFVKEQPLADTTWKHVSSLTDILQIRGRRLWGSQATKSRLMQSGFPYHIIHFATHAQSSDDNPGDSFIQFFPGIDDRLYLDDLYKLPLRFARLVVLSACSAGKGKNLRGEGNISIAHAIAQAGCPSVITTTWEANDQVISFMTNQLHQYLDKGFSIDMALKKARLDFFNNEELRKFSHPYYWANLTLIGNNQPVFPVPTMPGSTPLVAVIFILVGLAVAVKIYFKRKGTPDEEPTMVS
ncbi:CHAT domain-containing protein [Dyadobacter sp. SG02]|uniref:CHAT domain-containing protein n=1 Tax=Dyadobacter sp. SG02 TaxID=1855291 RepID=UPI0008B8E6C0|nr:CHAT domain-containing protein [Dyadobacter sp. SG02]SEI49847.1 CHAT domain-containing protein [Dyadobacter sp. SG02]